jgi:hypothetical protein
MGEAKIQREMPGTFRGDGTAEQVSDLICDYTKDRAAFCLFIISDGGRDVRVHIVAKTPEDIRHQILGICGEVFGEPFCCPQSREQFDYMVQEFAGKATRARMLSAAEDRLIELEKKRTLCCALVVAEENGVPVARSFTMMPDMGGAKFLTAPLAMTAVGVGLPGTIWEATVAVQQTPAT